MKNAYAIGDLAVVLGKTCETIGVIANCMSNAEQRENPILMESYSDMMLNSLEIAQHSIIALTQLVTENAGDKEINSDGSALMSGEHDGGIDGEKTIDKTCNEEEGK